jgi:hypothetical protein
MRKLTIVLFTLLIILTAQSSFAVCLTCGDDCLCTQGFPGAPRCKVGADNCCKVLGTCLIPPRPIAGELTIASVEVSRPAAKAVRTVSTSRQKLASAKAPVTHIR